VDADLRSIAEARAAAERAWEAFERFRGTPPAVVDRIVEAMAHAAARDAERLGKLAAQETNCGNAEDKRIKNLFNALGILSWLENVRTLGVLWRDDRTKTVAIGEPMGVVAALIPVTNPTSTIIFKVLSAVKAGNAIVCAPHPRGVRSGVETAELMARVAEAEGAPPGLIQCLENVTIEGTGELMRHRRTSVVLATGGSAMVRAAYSSGKPTLAVGPGNVPVYVDVSKRQELSDVAEQIVFSKSFDYGTACVAEQALIAHRDVAGPLRDEFRLAGAYFCTDAQAERLARVIFGHRLRLVPENVGQSAARLAQLAGFDVPPRTRILVAELEKVGRDEPLSAEKLNPVLAFYQARDTEHGYELAEQVLRFGGLGHSAAVHADSAEVVARFSALPVGRILVNTPCVLGGMGYTTDIEPSFMLGTGTWSGSIVSDNVTALHLINVKRVAEECRPWRSFQEETW